MEFSLPVVGRPAVKPESVLEDCPQGRFAVGLPVLFASARRQVFGCRRSWPTACDRQNIQGLRR